MGGIFAWEEPAKLDVIILSYKLPALYPGLCIHHSLPYLIQCEKDIPPFSKISSLGMKAQMVVGHDANEQIFIYALIIQICMRANFKHDLF
jgi:hypothetical protein